MNYTCTTPVLVGLICLCAFGYAQTSPQDDVAKSLNFRYEYSSPKLDSETPSTKLIPDYRAYMPMPDDTLTDEFYMPQSMYGTAFELDNIQIFSYATAYDVFPEFHEAVLKRAIGPSPRNSSRAELDEIIHTAKDDPNLSVAAQEMIREINFVRYAPASYAEELRPYLDTLAKIGIVTAEDYKVIDYLKGLGSAQPLKPHPALYRAASLHLEDQRLYNTFNLLGNDNSFPWERIEREDSLLNDGNENLVAGTSSVKAAIAYLIIDPGTRTKGHRKNILDAEWQYVSCLYAGNVSKYKNCWIQEFARTDTAKLPPRYRPLPESLLALEKEPYINTAADVNYMTKREKKMVAYINIARRYPQEFIPYLERYIEEEERKEGYTKVESTKELIQEMRQMEPMSLLMPDPNLYKTAEEHGRYEQLQGEQSHTGKGGTDPWDRVRAANPEKFEYGKENLVGGKPDVLSALILTLVDDGIPTRSHRHTVLDPAWQYVACKEVERIGDIPNCWVQLYGTTQPYDIPLHEQTPDDVMDALRDGKYHGMNYERVEAETVEKETEKIQPPH